MTEVRQVWIEPEDIGGREPRVGQWYALTRACSDFALRGADGTPPLPVGRVVAVVELRSYGAALAQEVEVVPDLNIGLQAACELASEGLFEVREAPAHGPINPETLHGVGEGKASTACGIIGGSHAHPALRITYNPGLVNCPVCKPEPTRNKILCEAGHEPDFGPATSEQDEGGEPLFPYCCYVGQMLWLANRIRDAAESEGEEDAMRYTAVEDGETIVDIAAHLQDHIHDRGYHE